MTIDFTELDKVITLLQKKSIGGGSPPVVEEGHLGLWRTVRGHRMFLELQPGTGKWAVDVKGKPHIQGKVLVGPPSLVNQPIGGVDNGVWDKLSGSGTKRTFPSATPEGLKSLKSSLRNSLKADDTRIAAIDGTDELPKLVQIARSAGFTDDEIKAALGGRVFQNGLSSKVTALKPKAPAADTEADVPTDNVIPFKRKPKAPEAEAPASEKTPAEVEEPTKLPTKKPEAPVTPTGGKMTADGAFAPLIEALTAPASDGEDQKAAAAKALDSAAEKLGEEFLQRQVRALADGLRTGDFTLDDVKTEIATLAEHRRARILEAMDEEAMDKLADKAAAKETVSAIKQRAASSGASVEANAAFYHDQLMALSRRVNNPEVSRQLVVLARSVKSRKLGGNSVVLRALALLRLILAFIPGV